MALALHTADSFRLRGGCRCSADIGERTDTRFLIITHHAVTISQMDRLFGVTMARQGVSQLVSIDLAVVERIVESA